MADQFQQMQAQHLAILLDALEGVELSDAERRTLEWLAGSEHETVTNIAAVITRHGYCGIPDRRSLPSLGVTVRHKPTAILALSTHMRVDARVCAVVALSASSAVNSTRPTPSGLATSLVSSSRHDSTT
jgi:hypothetical protein